MPYMQKPILITMNHTIENLERIIVIRKKMVNPQVKSSTSQSPLGLYNNPCNHFPFPGPLQLQYHYFPLLILKDSPSFFKKK